MFAQAIWIKKAKRGVHRGGRCPQRSWLTSCQEVLQGTVAQWMHGAQGKDDGTCITTTVSHTNNTMVYKIQFINMQWVLNTDSLGYYYLKYSIVIVHLSLCYVQEFAFLEFEKQKESDVFQAAP